MKIPKPIKKVIIKLIDFVLSVPFLKNTAKRLLSPNSKLYRRLYLGYLNAKNTSAVDIPVNTQVYTIDVLEHAMKTVSLEQMQIFQMLLNHGDVISEGVYDENCY